MSFLFFWSWFESLNIHVEEGNAKSLHDLWIEDYTLGHREELWHHINNGKLIQTWLQILGVRELKDEKPQNHIKM